MTSTIRKKTNCRGVRLTGKNRNPFKIARAIQRSANLATKFAVWTLLTFYNLNQTFSYEQFGVGEAMGQERVQPEIERDKESENVTSTNQSQGSTQTTNPDSLNSGDLPLGYRNVDLSLLSSERQDKAATPGANIVAGVESEIRSSTDAGSLLGKSQSSTGVDVQHRSPIANDPRIRGYHSGQILSSLDGAYYIPARQDLDTMLSKIDSGIIRDMLVLKGPYSARHGPGFSFIDIATNPTPRYRNGEEWHGQNSLNFQTNGEQWYGRQTLFGGSSDWGVRVDYGHRTGSDYETGDGFQIPTSYKSRDLSLAVGLDLAPDSHLELGYHRLDQTDVEFPGLVFDINYLVTDAFNLSYVLENQCEFDRLTVNAWYNRTRFEGDAQRSGKRRQIPELDDVLFGDLNGDGINDVPGLAITDVDQSSTGFRTGVTWGELADPQLTLGFDFRHIGQRLNDIEPLRPPDENNFPIPESMSVNPGLFAELVLPISRRLTIKSGGRIDWVSTDAADHVEGVADPISVIHGTGLEQHFNLWSFYLTGNYEICKHWSASGGIGFAQRPPTLTELYAVGSFIGVLQPGLTSVFGDPELDPERVRQIDLGIKADYGCVRAGVHGFYAWISDYITFDERAPDPDFPDDFADFYTNTDLATLAGFELTSELDMTDCLTGFANMSFVEGRDRSRREPAPFFDRPRGDFAGASHEPLAGIPPLESRLGFRLHQTGKTPRWAIELAARVVDNQDRLALTLGEPETPGFTTWDLRGYWRPTDRVTWVAGVENFTDKFYREHLDLRAGRGVFQPGINFYFGLQLNY